MALLRINHQPSRTQLFVFSAACFVVAGIAAFGQRSRGHLVVGEVLAVVAVAMPLLAWLTPRVVRWIFLSLSYATYPIGFVLSYVVLGLIYFGVFSVVGILMRLFGRDPLARRFDRTAQTYWQPRGQTPSAESYLRQR